jgi:phosphoglycerate dehydrogenase-like enzyme
MKLTILYDDIFQEYSEEALNGLRDSVPGVTVSSLPRVSVELDQLIDSEVIFGWAPPHLLKDLKNLKWLHLSSAGANSYTDRSLYANPSVLLTKSSGTFGIPIAEHVVGMMISLSRNFEFCYENQKKGIWHRGDSISLDLFDSNVLVLGLGDIGTEVCSRLLGFGCNITGFRHDTSIPHELVSCVRPISLLRESLPDADYIVICLPGTAETRNLIGREELELMKSRAIIINIGRGSIIDTDALVDALNGGKIAGAGLDVTEPEPLPQGHPLWSARNVLITPHVSASSALSPQRRLDIFTDLLQHYMSGQHMYNIVDFDSGY